MISTMVSHRTAVRLIDARLGGLAMAVCGVGQ